MTALAAGLLAAVLAVPVPAADKPTPRQKAKELLDGASEMIAATRPETQAAALFHLADNYQAFDRKKSIEYFNQAFTSAGSATVGARSLQTEIVVALATLDTEEGITLLKQIEAPTEGYDNRSFAAARVIGALVQKGQFQTAIDLADYMGAGGAYPYEGISILLGKLPPGDEQIASVFSGALRAYTVKPDRSFPRMLMRFRKQLPPGMPAAALSRILSNILDSKSDKPYEPLTLSSSKGTVTFTNREEADLFDVMPLVREVDPKRYDELLSSHAELRSALQIFPGGGPSVADDRGTMAYTVSSNSRGRDPAAEKRAMEAMNSRMQLQALINTRVQTALAALPKDPDKALDLASEIPSPPKQAEVLAVIARGVAGNDTIKGARVLSRCIGMLDDLKYPDDRVLVWDLVAEAAAVIKDDQIAQRAIEKLLTDAAVLYKDDTDKDRANRGARETWPSTQAYRHAVIRAAKLMQVDAESLLPKITDPDLNVLARITLAQALLERPFDRMPSYGRQHPPQMR
jgi:hypothetical protein